jgi:hypothetical protein
MRATIVSAFANDEALDRVRSFMVASVVAPVSDMLPSDDPVLRLTLAMGHLVGIALSRHLIKLPAVGERELEAIVALVAPAVQNYLTGTLPLSRAATNASD